MQNIEEKFQKVTLLESSISSSVMVPLFPMMAYLGQPHTYGHFGLTSTGVPIQGTLALVIIPPEMNPKDALAANCQMFILSSPPSDFDSFQCDQKESMDVATPPPSAPQIIKSENSIAASTAAIYLSPLRTPLECDDDDPIQHFRADPQKTLTPPLPTTPPQRPNNDGDFSCSSPSLLTPVCVSDGEFNAEDFLHPTPPQRKEKWIKPLTPKSGGGDSSSSKYKSRINKGKKMKQQTITSMAKKMPQQMRDISTLKEFNGGFQPSLEETVYPVKRKSDEMQFDSSTTKSLDDTDKVAMAVPNLEEEEDLDMTTFEPDLPPLELSSIFQDEPENVAPSFSPGFTNSNPQNVSTSTTTTTAAGRPKFTFKSTNKASKVPDLNSTEDIIKDFNKLPDRVINVFPTKPVRKKEERAKLPGWACDQCRTYYENLESQMHPSELQKLKDKCSRHRSHRNIDLNNTHPEFWDTRMPSTEDAYAQGYIHVGIASPPAPKRRNDIFENDL